MTVDSGLRKISQKKKFKNIHQNSAWEERSRLKEHRISLTHHTHKSTMGLENNTLARRGRKGRKDFSLNGVFWVLNWALILIHLKEFSRMITCVFSSANSRRTWCSRSEVEFSTTQSAQLTWPLLQPLSEPGTPNRTGPCALLLSCQPSKRTPAFHSLQGKCEFFPWGYNLPML